jgi:hypothetical protein
VVALFGQVWLAFLVLPLAFIAAVMSFLERIESQDQGSKKREDAL